MRTFIIALVGVIVALLGGSYLLKAGPQKADYYTADVERRSIVESVSATGSAEPLEVFYVQSETLGIVDQVLVTYNDVVEQGQTLAKINSEIQQVKLENAMADLDAAEAAQRTASVGIELARAAEKAAMADLDAARRAVEEAEESFKQDPPLIPKTKLDQQTDMFKKAQAGMEAAQKQVKQATAFFEAARTKVDAARVGIRAAQLELSKTELKSPAAGIILNMNCKVGDMVGRPKLALSEPSPAIFEIARPLERMRAVVLVNEVDYSRVQPGQDVKFNVDAYPDVDFRGKVVQIRNSARADRTAVSYDTVIEFENQRDPKTNDWMIRPRATCRADVLVRGVENVLAVPNDALLFSPPVNSTDIPSVEPGESLVWLLDDSNQLIYRKVRTGISDGFWTEVTAGEIEPGSRVVTGVPASSEGFKIPTIGG